MTYCFSVSARVRTIAALTVLVFVTEFLTLPCGTACHQSQAEDAGAATADASSEHSCHEAPVQENVTQIAGVPSACTHQHDAPDAPRTSASNDRDHQTALVPAFVLVPSYVDVVPVRATPSPRDSISLARLSQSLRI